MREAIVKRKCIVFSLAFGSVLLGPAPVAAQMTTQAFQSEVRVDGIIARTSSLEAGYGLSVPAGIYVRTGLIAGVGAGSHGATGRTDFIARYSLDPFRQSSWAPYAGAGLSGRYRSSADGGSRAYLLVFVGVEGPVAGGKASGWVPAFELGLGGGARVGVVFRRGVAGRR